MSPEQALADAAICDIAHLWNADEDEDERECSREIFGDYVDYLGELGVLVNG